MAYGVRKWPNSNDPRTTAWMPYGWEWGAIPAYKYLLLTTNAIGNYARLNDGVTVNLFDEDLGVYHFRRVFAAPPTMEINLFISGFETIQPAPVDHTVWWFMNAVGAFGELYAGNNYALYPNAITGWPDMTMIVQSGLPDLIPDPVAIIPQMWDAPQVP